MPTRKDFQNALDELFREGSGKSARYIDIRAGNLHRKVGGYPGNHRMPTCCDVMRENIQPRDNILHEPPKGKGASLEIRYSLPRGKTNEEQNNNASKEEDILKNITKENTLIVISCTNDKIWDAPVNLLSSYVPAGFAYTGGTFQRWQVARKSCQKLNDFSWVILSAKYGFIEPEHPIGNYDVTFSNPETGPISDESLNRQVANQKRNIGDKQTLKEFEHVVILHGRGRGGKCYVDAVTKAFNKEPIDFDRFLRLICSSHSNPTTRSANKPFEGS